MTVVAAARPALVAACVGGFNLKSGGKTAALQS